MAKAPADVWAKKYGRRRECFQEVQARRVSRWGIFGKVVAPFLWTLKEVITLAADKFLHAFERLFLYLIFKEALSAGFSGGQGFLRMWVRCVQWTIK